MDKDGEQERRYIEELEVLAGIRKPTAPKKPKRVKAHKQFPHLYALYVAARKAGLTVG